MSKFAKLKSDLFSNLGRIASKIQNSRKAGNRAAVLVSLYKWWNSILLHKSPKFKENEKKSLRNEFERNFWRNYILNNLCESSYWLFGGLGHEYHHPERAIYDRLASHDINIAKEAGIKRWRMGIERVFDQNPVESWITQDTDELGAKYKGSDDTAKLVKWARTWPVNTFE